MKFDSLFAPLTGPVWSRPIVFLGRMVRFNPVTVAVVALVLSALGVLEGLGLSILLPLLALIGLETGSKAGGPARAVESFFTALGIPLTLGPVLAVFFTVGMVLILLHAIQQYLLIRSTEQITSQLRCRLFDAASEASWKVLISGRGAHLVNAIVSETARIGVVYGNAMSAFGMGFSFVVYLALAAWVSWQLTLLAAVIGIISMMTLRGIYRSSRRFGRYTSEATNRMQEVLNEHISSAKLLRAFGAGAWSRATFAKAVDAVAEYLRRNQANSLWVKTSVEPFGLLMIVAMVYYSIEVVRLPAAELMLMLLIVFRLTPRLVALQELFQRITGMLPAYEAVADALHGLTRAKEPQGQTAFKSLQREIEFKGVTVRREGHTVLNSVNFKIPVHATIALVGRSGGGKTTLLDVIAGLLNPDSGNVLVDGISLVELNLDTFRNRIGLVPQESYFFHDTIAANLRIAAPQARDDQIWAALKLAHADEFVATRKEGLAAVIGDQGLRLSGGQRQRLSLARALLRNPDILLLDEATSAIDPETEQIILNTLKDLHGKLTIVLVTHRLSMTVDADMVYTVSQGQVEPWTEDVKEPSGGCA